MSKIENSQDQSQYVIKWNVLFERNKSHWMVVNSDEGVHVYVCFACRDLFSSKTSFLDHINRISVGLRYDCPHCSKLFRFYNPCTLLLHARIHFDSTVGKINLDNMELFLLPSGIVGFPPHPGISTMFEDIQEEMATVHMNTYFYKPIGRQKGLKCVKLAASFLLFFNNNADKKTTTILKQVCTNLPKCVFVIINNGKKCNEDNPTVLDNTSNYNAVNLTEHLESISKCPECDMALVGETRQAHFQQASMPLTIKPRCQVCDFVSPGICSFKAHCRLHTLTPPFVCPECGLTFNQCIDILEHQTEGCYHFSKQVKMKCSKGNCTKVFTCRTRYKRHFMLHFKFIIGCKECNIFYLSRKEFDHHVMQHHKNKHITPHINYRCTDDCMNGGLTKQTYTEHIDWHCNPNDPYNQVYVYTCRYCKKDFRTRETFAAHAMFCDRRNYTLEDLLAMRTPPKMTYCANCRFVVLFQIFAFNCPKCGDSENWSHFDPRYKRIKQYRCSLCNRHVLPNIEHKCKFENPIFVLRDNTIIFIEQKDSKGTNTKSPNILPEKRKLKSTSSNLPNSKKKFVRDSVDDREVSSDISKPFDGTYSCELCDYITAQREDFQNHLLTHRDGAVHQCLECNESFVLKPSFKKHLIYFHQTTDVDKYIAENSCCDQDMENRLQNYFKTKQSEEHQFGNDFE